METRDSATLDAITWFESLARLSALAATDAPVENVLRLSRHLAVLAPPPFCAIVAPAPDEAAFDELLERQAFEAAAIALIGTALSHEIVANDETDQATVRLWLGSDAAEALLVSSDTLALALIRAWTAFMLGLNAGQATGSSHRSA